jgi:putative membrane protein
MRDPLAVALIRLLVTGLSVVLVGKVLPGVTVKGYGSALLFAFVIALLNAIAFYSFGAPRALGFGVLSFGLGAFIFNTFLFWLGGKIAPGVEISGCITAALAALGVSITNWLLYGLVAFVLA